MAQSSKQKFRLLRTTFFKVYDAQYLYDAMNIVVEEFGVLMDWDTAYIRQLTFMATSAIARREKRAEEARIASAMAARHSR